MASRWPTELRLSKSAKTLEILFDDNLRIRLGAGYLRVNSPSAEVQGHGGRKPPPPTGKEEVAILDIQPVGNYAVRLIFDDGHDSGLYTWDYLFELHAHPHRFAAPGGQAAEN